MKIGIMGGSFNPIHLGHLNTANEVATALDLEKVFFVVSARPPHKEEEGLIEAVHRYRMVELACADNPAFEASDIEMQRPGPSYTIDTIRFFQERYGKNIYFILGQDAMEDIAAWKAASTLLKTCNFIVVTRPGYDSSALLDLVQSVLSLHYRNLHLQERFRADDGSMEVFGVTGATSTITLTRVTGLDISASDIRKRVAHGESVRYLVPDASLRYMKENRIGFNYEK